MLVVKPGSVLSSSVTVASLPLEDYDRWLHWFANHLLGPTHNLHDGLVNEGRIAMWRAFDKFDSSRGALPPWLTTAARTQMRFMAFGRGQPFGHEAHRGKREVTWVTTDKIQELQEMLTPEESDIADKAMIAYHRGEIVTAIGSLTPVQQSAVRVFMRGGLLSGAERAACSVAFRYLALKLERLACEYE